MDLKLKNNSLLNLFKGDYIPIEYVVTNGNCNISTGINVVFASSLGIAGVEATIEVLNTTTGNPYIYFAERGTLAFKLQCDSSYNSFTACSYTKASSVSLNFEGKVKLLHKQKPSQITINNNIVNLDGDVGSATGGYLNLFVGTQNTKIWNIKIHNYKNNIVLRNYIPVISLQNGHYGEACLYDTVNNTFYYAASTGSFVPSTSLIDKITTAYITDCPNVSAINILRLSYGLTNIHCSIGTSEISTIAELQQWATLHGFNENEQPDNTERPYINGTVTINSYYTSSELSTLEGLIDGLTIVANEDYNIDSILQNDNYAVQCYDENFPRYNPAVGIIMQNGGYGCTTIDSVSGGTGRWLLTKSQAAALQSIGTLFRGKTSVIDTNGIVSSDTTASYSFNSFDEFKYFTGVTTITAGSSTSSLGAFGGCTNLTSIEIPNSVTTIGAYAFYNDTSLSVIETTTSITSIGTRALRNCSSIVDLYLPNVTLNAPNISGSGNGTGILTVKSWSKNGDNEACAYKNIITLDDVNITNTSGYVITTQKKSSNKAIQTVSFLGDLNTTLTMIVGGGASTAGDIRFVRLIGTGSGSGSLARDAILSSNGCIIYLGYDTVTNDTVPCTPTFIKADNSRVTKVYVGDGSSSAHDSAIMQKYLDDTNWASYSSKLDLWYNYNGQYRTYIVIDTLTNCTNTNVITVPYITRGESYQTTIVPEEGMTLDSVTVEMYEAVDDGTTPNTPTDITNDVYNASTGEINIPAVTGNVIITASAS